jgi:hypothetical protein
MPEKLGDVEKISCTAAKVENPFSARQIELDVTNAPGRLKVFLFYGRVAHHTL